MASDLSLQISIVIKDLASGILKNMKGRFDETSSSIKRLNAKLDRLPATTAAATKNFNNLTQTLMGFVTAYASFIIASHVTDLVETAAETQQLNTRLQGLTNSLQIYTESWQYLWQTATRFSVDIHGLADSYTKLLALQKSGIITTTDAKEVLEGFSNVAAETGAESVQLKQSLYGLAQGLSAGVLRAEELNQITEPLPGLLQRLDQAAGVAAGGFRKLVLEGEITSDVLRETLLKALKSYEGAAERTAANLGPTFIRMTNAYTEFKVALEKPIAALLTPLMDSLIIHFKELARYVRENSEQLIQNAKTIAIHVGALTSASGAVIQFLSDNKELILILGGLYVVLKLVRVTMMALAAVQLGSTFSNLASIIVATTAVFRGFIALQVIVWFTGAAAGATALTVALTRLSLVIAAGFAVNEIVKLTQTLYEFYQVRQLQRQAETDLQKATERNRAKLAKLSETLGIVIPDMETFFRLEKEGVIVRDKANGAWVKAKDAVADYAKEIQALEDEIVQKKGSVNQKKMALDKAESSAVKLTLKGMLEGRIQLNTQIIQQAGLTTKELIKLETQAADKINELHKSLANEKLSLEDQIRKLYRREMSKEGAQADLESQITEKLQTARQALASGNTEQASQLAKQVKSLIDNVKDTDKAVALLKQSSEVVQQAMQANIDKTQQFKDELSRQENSQIQVEADISQAEQQIALLQAKLDTLKDKMVTVTVKRQEAHHSGGVVGYALGGTVSGIGNRDSVPALLTPGEYVIKKQRALKFRELLNLINFAPVEIINKALDNKLVGFNLGGPVLSMPQLPVLRYAEGGPVSAMPSAPMETVRLEWKIGQRQGQVDTLMNQRQNLQALVAAINETSRGL
ncbi:MAG: hypothetical protein B6247_04030 [Candidatus Parabeggiatoa sp. nov. 2]|nr:MAG: hypothetical protein B6247_04030 [Beggiatoa sp. 4572_84]